METDCRIILILLAGFLGSCSKLEEIPPLEPPLAIFEAKNNVCSAPCPIEFENSSLNARQFLWNFGDGSSPDTSQNPIHTYQNPGTFRVALIAFAKYVSDTIEKDITILPFDHNHPKANFSFENDSCGAPCTIIFMNSSQKATEYIWNFGEGNNSSELNPSYIYEIPGSYTVMLIASNGEIKDTIFKSITINQISFEKQFLDCEGSAFDLIQLEDGGFALAGNSGFVARIDKHGNTVWKNCGSSISYIALEQDNFGDLILIHNYLETPTLEKFTSNGGLIYSDYLFPISSEHNTYASDLTVSDNGDYHILGKFGQSPGSYTNRFFVIHRSPPRTKFDTTFFSNSASNLSGEIYNIPGKGIVFNGYEHHFSVPSNYYLVWILDSTGRNVIDGRSFTNVRIEKFAPLKDGNFIILGETFSNTSLDLWKLEFPDNWSLGTSIPINDPNYNRISAQKIAEIEGGGYAGIANIYIEEIEGIGSGLFFLTNLEGHLIKYEIFGGIESHDGLYSLIQTSDGGFAISGMKDGHPLIIKTDSEGNIDF